MNPNSSTPAQFSFGDLETALATAAALGKQLVADERHGQSQFAAGIRSAIDHAADLVAKQKQWAAANPALLQVGQDLPVLTSK